MFSNQIRIVGEELPDIYKQTSANNGFSNKDGISQLILRYMGYGHAEEPSSSSTDSLILSIQGIFRTENLLAISNPARKLIHLICFNLSKGILEEVAKPLTVCNMGSILCMTWSNYTDTLIIGTNGGVMCVTSEGTVGNFIAHEKKKSVSEISVSPDGRLIAALSKNDNVLYILDSLLSTTSALHCLNGSTTRVDMSSCLEFSPDGNIIILVTMDNEVIMVDTSSWNHHSCGQTEYSIQSGCWLSPYTWLFAVHESLNVGAIHFDNSSRSITPVRVDSAFATIDMDSIMSRADILGYSGEISSHSVKDIISDPSGTFVAMTFYRKVNGDHTLAPLVATFLCQTDPFVTFTLLKVLTKERPIGPIDSEWDPSESTASNPVSFQFFAPDRGNFRSRSAKLAVVWSTDGDIDSFELTITDF